MGRASRKGGGGGGAMRSSQPEVTTSPWGNEINNVEEMAPGVYRVDTPSHGGIMISREVGDEILSAEARRVGAGFGYSPERPWSREWYVFEEDDDWVAAASDLEAAFEINMNGGLEKGSVQMPAEELKPGYVVLDTSSGEDATVEDVSRLSDGRVEVALQWGRGDQIGGGRRTFEADEEIAVERLQRPSQRDSRQEVSHSQDLADTDQDRPDICERCGDKLSAKRWDLGHCEDCEAILILEQLDTNE